MAQNETKTDKGADPRTAQAATAPSLTHGGALVKLLVGIPLALIATLLLAIAFYEGRKAYWDWRVKQMCEEDGGLVILDKRASYKPRLKSHGESGFLSAVIPLHPGSPIDVEYRSIDIRSSNPHVFRSETKYVRRADKQLIAIQVVYSRSGGDFLHFHQSSYGCPRFETIKSELDVLLSTEERK